MLLALLVYGMVIYDIKEIMNELINLYNQKDFDKLINVGNNYIKNNILYDVIYNIMGVAYHNLNKYDPAIECFKKAINLNPSFAEAYNNIGYPLRLKGNIDLAIKNHRKAITLRENFVEAKINLGFCLSQKKEFDLAIEVFEQVLKINPQSKDIYFNIGSVLIEKGNYTRALKIFKKLEKNNPDDFSILNNLGNIFKFQDKIDNALTHYKKAIELNKNDTESLWNYSYCSLYKYDFKNGWLNYHLRWQMNNIQAPHLKYNKPIWDGVSDGIILVYLEQGLGDQILFSRCLRYFETKKNKVFFLVQNKLLKLFSLSFPKIKFIDKITNLNFDYLIAVADMPKFCIKNIANLQSFSIPYLKVDSNFSKSIKLRISKEKTICGLSWISKSESNGKNKSINLELLKTIILIPNIVFVDLQYTDTSEERRVFFEKYGIKILKLNNIDNFNNITKLCSLIEACDFVITISNSTAHLSGALGKNTFLMLPKGKGKFWYWSTVNNTCYWYPSIKIIEQNEIGIWDNVIKELTCKVEIELTNSGSNH